MAFVFLSQLSRIFIGPLFLAMTLLAAALVLNKTKSAAYYLTLGGLLLLVAASTPITSSWLVSSLEGQYPDSSLATFEPAEVIVVLGGAVHSPNRQHPTSHMMNSSDRLLVALRLYHAGKAPLVLCSGGNLFFFKKTGGAPESQVMCGILQEWGLPESAVLTEGESINTHENAVMSYKLLSARNIRRIILVTSAWHMPRAAATFRKAGFEVVAAPADFSAGWSGGTQLWVPDVECLRSTELALREWLGLLTYRLRGWA